MWSPEWNGEDRIRLDEGAWGCRGGGLVVKESDLELSLFLPEVGRLDGVFLLEGGEEGDAKLLLGDEEEEDGKVLMGVEGDPMLIEGELSKGGDVIDSLLVRGIEVSFKSHDVWCLIKSLSENISLQNSQGSMAGATRLSSGCNYIKQKTF